MVLRTLRLHGFKSFADPIEVQFPGKVTGIIGPNGCGKSNIVDAIRFVLGEQSLRLLRARKIDDLIFAGNLRRPATSLAEVGLVMDNSSRWLDIDYPEIEIRRVIQRDGESKYFLNGTGVRLKDIQKMFMDVGVNKGHYSVIGQGQVQMIVSASPEERRQYFEEAAGIVSYRQSKKETMRRLDEVHKNIEQAGIFAADYESRMHGLKVQAGRAQKYLEYQTAYRRLYLFNANLRFHLIRDEMEEIRKKTDSSNAERESLEKSAAEAARREAALAGEREALQDQVAESSESVRALEMDRMEKDKQLAAADEKVYSLRRNLNEIDISLAKLARSAEEKNSNGEESGSWKSDPAACIARQKKEIHVAADRAEWELDRVRAELSATEKNLGAEEERLDTGRADILSAHEALAALDSTLSSLASSAEEIRTQMEKLAAQVAADDARMQGSAEELSALERRRAECGQAQTAAELAAEEAGKRLDASRDVLNCLRAEMAEVDGRFRSLNAAEEAREGFSSSVRLVMERFDKKDEFLGVVRDLITFDAPYAKAIEAALGPKLQHMVVERGDTVKEILREMSNTLRGRVTFWALDLLPVPGAAPELPAGDQQDGIVSWAVSLLRYDPKLRRLFENLLGWTLVVKDMDSLLAAAKRLRGISIVTLDGAYYRRGAITAGPTTGAILIGRKQELSETESRLKDLANRIAAEEEVHRRACSELSAARSTAEAAYRRYKDADAEHMRATAAGDSAGQLAQERRRQLDAAGELLSQKMAAISSARAKHAEMQEAGGKNSVEARQELEELRRQAQTLRAESEAALEGVRSLKEKERDLARVESEILDFSSRRAALAGEIEAAQEGIAQLHDEMAKIDRQLAEDRERLRALQEAFSKTVAGLEESRAKIAECQRHMQKIRDDAHGHELRLATLSAERGNIRENVMNEMQTDIESLTETLEAPDGADDCPAQLRDLQMKMQKLGTVNVNAIEEFNEVSAKHGELASQLADLTQARENLKEVLRKTDRICRERFAEVFQRVAGHFQDVTKKLFLGGEGKLILTESEELMESGVDIQLRPPGKGFTSIASRSGGEQALAGICLLFALFMEKPSPFCFLDEVDAALDDVNVGRLARLVEEFSDKIQFVIVTHNKLTMQSASCLFGATMEDAGITKLISVRMKPAQESQVALAS